MIRNLEQLLAVKEKYNKAMKKQTSSLLLCAGTGCMANGAEQVYNALKDELAKRDVLVTVDYLLEDGCGGITTTTTGCHGFCEMGPLVRVEPTGTLYVKVKPEDAAEIVEATVNNQVVERLLYRHPNTGEVYQRESEIPFYKYQTRVALANCGEINPEDIRNYIAHDGYQGLEKALRLSPQEVVQMINDSNLRGRGGGGFPAGRKWAIAAAQESDKKYIICNGDEGDPGAFMDRSVMEGDPHRIIEAMAIAGYAIGADEGYIYVRAEYPLAVQRLRTAIKQAQEYGLLGKDIFGSGFNFELKIKEGAGAFVCGEESALIASIEGERGMPRPKPPFPAVSGLWDKPTIINNVETLANVPEIIRKGVDWFKSIGAVKSPGTKTFALTGEVANTGLIEVPMGTTMRHVVFEIGGGVRQNKKFKAVQIGGPSGGCLVEEHFDLPLDFDSLQAAGAMVGSGGLVVMDENTCIVEIARFFMNFTQNESCGKCVLCREGTRRMLEILQKIVEGRGTEEDLDLLEEIGESVQIGSLCGLGKTAPNPVLTTLKYFREEYLAHVVEKRCPAGVCQALKRITIVADLCKGCSRCARVCPVGAIEGEIKNPFVINQEKCIKCGACIESCKFNAIVEVS
ncbi:MAG: NADH-quinone oxidoreductase subunit NuoF [Firmicutes bacterium]|nr:NADH-quinone oxidoreductase subunit NuoF [Bacillota bacterium]